MDKKELTLDSFQQELGENFNKWKGSWKEEKFDSLLNKHNFEQNKIRRESLRIELKQLGFFEGGSQGKKEIQFEIFTSPFGVNGLPNFLKGEVVISFREETVKSIMRLILFKHAIIVKGPPYSGKTDLAQLISLVASKEMTVRYATAKPGMNFETWWTSEMKVDLNNFELVSESTLFIIDEAQLLYEFDSGSPLESFWASVKRIQTDFAKYKAHIILFSAYGPATQISAYSAISVQFEQQSTISLDSFVIFPNTKNKMRVPGLLLVQEELQDIIKSFTKVLNIQISTDGIHWLSQITNNHVGLVIRILHDLSDFYSKQKIITAAQIFTYLRSNKLYSVVTSSRGLSGYSEVTKIEKQILISIICKSSEYRRPLKLKIENMNSEERAIENLIRLGLLYEKRGNGIVAFPSILHLNYFLSTLTEKVIPLTWSELNLKTFVITAIGRMRKQSLLESRSRDSTGLLYEAVWQFEFFLAASPLLPSPILLSPNVGADLFSNVKDVSTSNSSFNEVPVTQDVDMDEESSVYAPSLGEEYDEDDLDDESTKLRHGFMDFYVNSKLGWAIELLREGRKIQKHLDRFVGEGIYVPYLPCIKDYVVIDFRSVSCNAPFESQAHLATACHAEDFSTITLYWPKEANPTIIRLV